MAHTDGPAAKRHQEYLDYAGGHEGFAAWLYLVDHYMQRTVGVTHRDIADWTWRDAFEDGMTPVEAAREALAEDDVYGMAVGTGLFD